jgi:hypothetical protein
VKQPVFSFEAEVLTNAPFGHIRERVLAGGPEGFASLGALRQWRPPDLTQDRMVLPWVRTVIGAEESGELTIVLDPEGAHLRLEGRMKGWSAFLLFGWLRWRTDRLLDRFVEEL